MLLALWCNVLLVCAGAGVAGSGAALSSTSTVEALGALGALLVLTLGDNSALQSWNHPHATAKENGVRLAEAAQANTQIGASESALGAYDQHVHGSSHSLNASSALQRLRQLSVEGCTIGKAGATHGSSASIRLHSGIPPPARDETAAPVSSTYVKGDAGQEMAGTRFRVDRNWEWVKSTTGRLHDILVIVIPPLCAVQQPVVRQKLAKGQCSTATPAQRPTRGVHSAQRFQHALADAYLCAGLVLVLMPWL